MRAQKEAIGALIPSPNKHMTRERAEFEIYSQKVGLLISKLNTLI